MKINGIFLMGHLGMFLASMVFMGCSRNNQGNAEEIVSSDLSASSTPGVVTYPISGDVTLTYWMELNNPNVSSNFTSLNDTEWAKYLQEETGVKINFISPPVGGGQDAFNLLVASGNMPDLIDYGWNRLPGYPGGPAAALANKVIIPLNNYLSSSAPDMKKIFDENPSYDKMVKTDDGIYYIFPVMKLDDYLNTTYGLFVRQDWLDELNLSSPVTIDDWYTMLKAFKIQKNAEYPLTIGGQGLGPFSNGMFIGAYGITKNWYLQDGKVCYGAYEDKYKDWLNTMAKWYAEGLLDSNFATNDVAAMDSNILTGRSGAAPFWIGSGLGKYIPELKKISSKATMAATTYPVLKAGDIPQFNSLLNPFDGAGTCITTSCKSPEIAVRFLNYGYTEKGRKTWNYGREGISYTIDGGVVNLTPAITQNPEGWPLGQAWSRYAHGVYPGPYFSERRFLELYYPYPEQIAALNAFTKSNMRGHLMPPVSPTMEESSEFARIMTNVQSLENEYTLSAIMGNVNIDSTFANYIDQLKGFGMDRAIEIQQGALERYKVR
jgi:putative aldouronate transport system substrate-binding protein